MDGPSTTIGYKRRKGSKHDKTGCLTCRFRRKKCLGNVLPTCEACARLNLVCIRQSATDIVPKDFLGRNQKAGSSLAPSLPGTSAITCTQEAGGDFPQRRHVMGYYINVLTRHLTVSESHNSFLSAFLPMATESPVFMDALFAFASGHLSMLDSTYATTALHARSKALKGLVAAMQAPLPEIAWHETIAAASLAFLMSAISFGDTDNWYSHLQGTENIISSAVAHSPSGSTLFGPEAFKQSSEGQWILRHFAYHDIIGTVSLRKKPLLDASYLDGITQVIDSHLGVGTDLLQLIARISCLDYDTRLTEDTDPEELEAKKTVFQEAYPHLEKSIRGWTCRPDAPPALAAMAYAYRSATLVYFYRLVRSRTEGSGNYSPEGGVIKTKVLRFVEGEIQTNVQQIIELVGAISVGSCPESTLLFPLFMVGVETQSNYHKQVIRTRLVSFLELRQFQNLSRALQVLERFWERREIAEEMGRSMDWTEVLDEFSMGEGLLLT